MKTLNVYPSDFYHEDVFLVGTKEALIDLRDQINKAINQINIGTASTIVFDNQGEDYHMIVASVNDERISLDNLKPHYAKLDHRDGESPIDFIGQGRYLSLVEPKDG